MFEGWSSEMINLFSNYFMFGMDIILFILLMLPIIYIVYGRNKKDK